MIRLLTILILYIFAFLTSHNAFAADTCKSAPPITNTFYLGYEPYSNDRDNHIISGYLGGKWQIRGDATGCGPNDMGSPTDPRKYCREIGNPGNTNRTWDDPCYNTFYGFDTDRLINNVVRTNVYTSVHPLAVNFAGTLTWTTTVAWPLAPMTWRAADYFRSQYGEIANTGFALPTAAFPAPTFTYSRFKLVRMGDRFHPYYNLNQQWCKTEVAYSDGTCRLRDDDQCTVDFGALGCANRDYLHEIVQNDGWSGSESTSFYDPPDVVTGQSTLNQGVFICLARTYKNQGYKHGGINTSNFNKVCAYVSDRSSCTPFELSYRKNWSDALIGCVDEQIKPAPPVYRKIINNRTRQAITVKAVSVTNQRILMPNSGGFFRPMAQVQKQSGNQVTNLDLTFIYPIDAAYAAHNECTSITMPDNTQLPHCCKTSTWGTEYCITPSISDAKLVCVCEKNKCNSYEYIGCVDRMTPKDSYAKLIAVPGYCTNSNNQPTPYIRPFFAQSNSNGDLFYTAGENGTKIKLAYDDSNNVYRDESNGQTYTYADIAKRFITGKASLGTLTCNCNDNKICPYKVGMNNYLVPAITLSLPEGVSSSKMLDYYLKEDRDNNGNVTSASYVQKTYKDESLFGLKFKALVTEARGNASLLAPYVINIGIPSNIGNLVPNCGVPSMVTSIDPNNYDSFYVPSNNRTDSLCTVWRWGPSCATNTKPTNTTIAKSLCTGIYTPPAGSMDLMCFQNENRWLTFNEQFLDGYAHVCGKLPKWGCSAATTASASSNWLTWPEMQPNTVVTQNCSHYNPDYVSVTRACPSGDDPEIYSTTIRPGFPAGLERTCPNPANVCPKNTCASPYSCAVSATKYALWDFDTFLSNSVNGYCRSPYNTSVTPLISCQAGKTVSVAGTCDFCRNVDLSALSPSDLNNQMAGYMYLSWSSRYPGQSETRNCTAVGERNNTVTRTCNNQSSNNTVIPSFNGTCSNPCGPITAASNIDSQYMPWNQSVQAHGGYVDQVCPGNTGITVRRRCDFNDAKDMVTKFFKLVGSSETLCSSEPSGACCPDPCGVVSTPTSQTGNISWPTPVALGTSQTQQCPLDSNSVTRTCSRDASGNITANYNGSCATNRTIPFKLYPQGRQCYNECDSECIRWYSRTGDGVELNPDVISLCNLSCKDGNYEFQTPIRIPNVVNSPQYININGTGAPIRNISYMVTSWRWQVTWGTYTWGWSCPVPSLSDYDTGLSVTSSSNVTVTLNNQAANEIVMCGYDVRQNDPVIGSYYAQSSLYFNGQIWHWWQPALYVRNTDWVDVKFWGVFDWSGGGNNWNYYPGGLSGGIGQYSVVDPWRQGYFHNPRGFDGWPSLYAHWGLTPYRLGNAGGYIDYAFVTESLRNASRVGSQFEIMYFRNYDREGDARNWGDNGGGYYIKVERKGCRYTDGTRLQYAVGAAGQIPPESSWVNVPISGGTASFRANASGKLYLRIKKFAPAEQSPFSCGSNCNNANFSAADLQRMYYNNVSGEYNLYVTVNY